MEIIKSLYKENFLFWLMFKVFVFIWLLSTVIFIAFCNYYGVEGDGSSIGAYMNLLVFDATIFAPIAAYFFYDNWKEQHNLTKKVQKAEMLLETYHLITQRFVNLQRAMDDYLQDELKKTGVDTFKTSKEARQYINDFKDCLPLINLQRDLSRIYFRDDVINDTNQKSFTLIHNSVKQINWYLDNKKNIDLENINGTLIHLGQEHLKNYDQIREHLTDNNYLFIK